MHNLLNSDWAKFQINYRNPSPLIIWYYYQLICIINKRYLQFSRMGNQTYNTSFLMRLIFSVILLISSQKFRKNKWRIFRGTMHPLIYIDDWWLMIDWWLLWKKNLKHIIYKCIFPKHMHGEYINNRSSVTSTKVQTWQLKWDILTSDQNLIHIFLVKIFISNFV